VGQPASGSMSFVRKIERWSWFALGLTWSFFRFFLFGFIKLALLVFLIPSIFLLHGLRSAFGEIARTDCRTHHPMKYLGGEGGVWSTGEDFSPRPAFVLLGARFSAFWIGVLLLIPFQMRAMTVGHPPLSVVTNNVGYLDTLIAPEYLLGDVFGTNGWLGGLALVTGVGAMFLSLPSPGEVEQSRLFLGVDLQIASRPARWLLSPLLVLSLAVESIEKLITLGIYPLYVTARLVPVLTGVLIASLLAARLVGQ